MLLLGVQCENRKKTPQQQKAHNHNIDTQLCNRGGNPALASSHPGPAAEFSAGPRPACQVGGLKRRRRWIGGWGNVSVCVIVCNQYVCMCNQQVSEEWGRNAESVSLRCFSGLISQQRPWPRPVLVEGAGKDKIVLV